MILFVLDIFWLDDAGVLVSVPGRWGWHGIWIWACACEWDGEFLAFDFGPVGDCTVVYDGEELLDLLILFAAS